MKGSGHAPYFGKYAPFLYATSLDMSLCEHSVSIAPAMRMRYLSHAGDNTGAIIDMRAAVVARPPTALRV